MGLNQAQKEAVSHKDGPCLVLAGPGSGKTLTIAKRIEYLIKMYKVRPEEILVITFTKYAAGEMRNRFRRVAGTAGFPVTFGTFHGVYYGILKWAYGLGRSNILGEQEKYALLQEIAMRDAWEDRAGEEDEKEFLQEIAGEIGNVKNNCFDIGTYEPAKSGAARFREIFLSYEAEKKKRRKIDFEDMLVLCYELFQNRPDILKKWQEKFRYILVDEFQDINQVQYNVARLLALPENNLFAVGDDDQSIYGFRGAKPGIMQEFCKDYPDVRQIFLNTNYRSAADIVNGASRVIAHNKCRFAKKVDPFQKGTGNIHVREVEDPLVESRYVASCCRKFIKEGVPPEQIAVLFRTAPDARMLAETFAEEQIPFHMKEHVEHIYDHFICTDLECYFRLAEGIWTRKDMLRVCNRPKRYIGRDSMAEGEVSFEALRRFYCDKRWMQDRIGQFERDVKMLQGKTPYAAVQYLRKSVEYDEFLKEYAIGRGLDQEELFQTLDEIQERAKGVPTITGWLSHVEECRKTAKERTRKDSFGNAVDFQTMHGAKGLEYEVVFIIGGNEGAMPHKKAQTEEEIEEERRLFYVAMTRAKKKLVISYVAEKNGKSKSRSRFISELLAPV